MLASEQTCNEVRVCDIVIVNKKDIVGLCPCFGHRILETWNFLYVFCYVNTVTFENLLKMESSCPGNQPCV